MHVPSDMPSDSAASRINVSNGGNQAVEPKDKWFPIETPSNPSCRARRTCSVCSERRWAIESAGRCSAPINNESFIACMRNFTEDDLFVPSAILTIGSRRTRAAQVGSHVPYWHKCEMTS